MMMAVSQLTVAIEYSGRTVAFCVLNEESSLGEQPQ
jgi:hypothetical protein